MHRRARHLNPSHCGAVLSLDSRFVAGQIDNINSPLSIPGCKLWLNADSIIGNDGDPIGIWTDGSGEGNDTVSVIGTSPILKKNILNARAVLRFGGGSAFLLPTLGISSASSIFVVAKSATASGEHVLIGRSNELHYLLVCPWGNGKVGLFCDAGADHTGICTNWNLIFTDASATATRLFLNSTQALVFGVTAIAEPLNLGVGWQNNYFNGDIAEIIIYNRALTPTERKRIEKYLNTKYALWQTPSDSDAISSWVDRSPNGNDAVQTNVSYQPTLIAPKPVARPTDLTGCKLWLNADSIEGNDGDKIATWIDNSGYGNDASQNTEGYKPILKKNILNGKNVLRFDGSDDGMLCGARLIAGTVFVISQYSAGLTFDGYRCLVGHNYNYTWEMFLGASGSTYWYPISASNERRQNGVVGSNRAILADFKLSSIIIPDSQHLQLGDFSVGYQQGFGRYWSGDIAEIIVYDRALSDYERRKVEAYLNNKYALWTPDGQGGNGVIKFSNSCFALPAQGITNSDNTIMLIAKSSIANSNGLLDTADGLKYMLGFPWGGNSNSATLYTSSTTPDYIILGDVVSDYRIFSTIRSAAGLEAFMQGISKGFHPGTVNFPDLTYLGMGYGGRFSGDVLAFKIYNSAISSSLLKRLEQNSAISFKIAY